MTEIDVSNHPRFNPELIGHSTVEQKFLSIWQSERVPHGWLLTGPRGIGKATLAFRIARFVLSNGGDQAASPGLFGEAVEPNLELDPENPVFRRIASGGHADLMTLERQINTDTNKLRTTIAVEDVRAAGDFLRLTASEGGWRVVIIDSVDELNVNAANALLKILEEPPNNALLLLVCHAPGRLLPTIRSRCCQMPLTPLQDEEVISILQRSNPDLPQSDLQPLCQLSDGSPGRATSLAEEGGLELYREMVSLLAALPNTETSALHSFGDRLARRGAEDNFRVVTELLSWWVSRLTRVGARGIEIPNIVPEEEGCANRLLSATGVDRWLEVWEKINMLARQTDGLNLDRKQALLNMFHALKGAATH
ncbi:MAG: DNA polymerase III subunit delta' [Alphaproteobacteria bacterium]|nr:DNA polymerase III subunit delta' [Alphaproteobacteria bacterium]